MSDPDQHIWTIVHLMQKNCVLLRHLETYLDHPTEWILNLDYVIHQIEQILQLSKLTLKIFRQDCVSSVYQELLANIIKQYKDHYTRMKEKRMHVQAYIKSLVEILTINRHISPSELNKIAPEVCGICLEVHVMSDPYESLPTYLLPRLFATVEKNLSRKYRSPFLSDLPNDYAKRYMLPPKNILSKNIGTESVIAWTS